jgi:hypothetical protein
MIVGITGHQYFENSSIEKWVKKCLKEQLSLIDIDFGISCIAIGSDQLFCKELIKKDIPFLALIPCSNYEKMFSDKDLPFYKNLLRRAKAIEILNFVAPSEESFWEAGKKIVSKSDLIIAVWNGEKAKGLGGTGDVVNFALTCSKKIIHLDTKSLTVKHI